MREVISVHVGQAGVQLGNACWELFCLEHSIQPDGQRVLHTPAEEASSTFFRESESGKHIPRSVFIDLDPSQIDEVRSGPYKNLYSSEQLISGKEDAASLYARGRYFLGSLIEDLCLEGVRKLADACYDLEGFMLYHSLGGGTGSGLGAMLLERLSDEYKGKIKVSLSVFPSPSVSTTVVEPYNSVLSTHSLIEHTDVSLVLDNEAIYDIAKHKLNIELPSYTNLNHMIAQVVSSSTSSIRFEGALNPNLHEFKSNLVPSPRMHFMFCSYVPFTSAADANHRHPLIQEFGSLLFAPESLMAKCSISQGKFMAVCLIAQGNIVPKNISPMIMHLKLDQTINFVDWCPAGFKCGINYNPVTVVPGGELARMPQTVCMICNSTSIIDVLIRSNTNFDKLLSRRAFVHWFVRDGMEESELYLAREDLASLEIEYINTESGIDGRATIPRSNS